MNNETTEQVIYPAGGFNYQTGKPVKGWPRKPSVKEDKKPQITPKEAEIVKQMVRLDFFKNEPELTLEIAMSIARIYSGTPAECLRQAGLRLSGSKGSESLAYYLLKASKLD